MAATFPSAFTTPPRGLAAFALREAISSIAYTLAPISLSPDQGKLPNALGKTPNAFREGDLVAVSYTHINFKDNLAAGHLCFCRCAGLN
jgi:hypothetical protein